jgi:2-polyprenyl-3-methyl-5-hydroxy-6-metoxy-1,4-benzoquinol methylase
VSFWDQQFAVDGFKYGMEPNAFLRSEAGRLTSGARILVPGDGEGRNSVWLATQGHRVLAMDASSVGLQKAQTLAAERGVTIETVLADLADWEPKAGRFDAVVLTFVHLPLHLRPLAHRRLARALKPGGLLLLEAFHPKQLGCSSGGPKQVEMLYTLADLRSDFSGLLAEESAAECEVTLDEGPGHQGAAWATRYIGRMA